MSKGMVVSIRLEAQLDCEVETVAAALDRPKAWVIEQAVRDYVALQTWQLAAIDEGLKDADEGRVVAHEDVAAWLQSWGRPDERPPPECG